MQRTSLKRAAAVLTAIGLCAVGSLALAPAASAAEIGATLTPGQPPVMINAANQSAGNLTVAVGAAGANDTVDITLGGVPASGDCSTAEGAAAAISWAAVPTISDPNVTGTLVDECPAGTVNITLRLKFTAADGDGTSITLSNIKYNATDATPAGPVEVSVNDVAPAADDSNATVNAVTRLFGPTRFDTAAEIAKQYHADKCADEVVIVNGTNFPDALAAAYLGKPILMVNSGLPIPAPTAKALDDLGVGSVIAVGGSDPISGDVLTAISQRSEKTCGLDIGVGNIGIVRRSGPNRYATAIDVATHGTGAGTFDTNTATAGCDGPQKTVIVVSGQNFPDALAAGALATGGPRSCGAGNIPILLTETNSLRPELPAAFAQLAPKNVIIVGGTGAVSDAVKTAIDDLPGVDTVNRVFGDTRQKTAVELSRVLLNVNQGGFSGDRLLVANGANFPDALAVGPLAGQNEWPILLSASPTSLGDDAANQIRFVTGAETVTMLGGTAALSDAVKAAIGSAILLRN